MAIFRDDRQAAVAEFGRLRTGHVGAIDHDGARLKGAQPRDGADDIALSVPFDPGNAEDLTGSNRQAQAIKGIAPDPGRHQLSCLKKGFNLVAKRCVVHLDGGDVLAGHRSGKGALVEVSAFDLDHLFAGANHGDSVRDLGDLGQLVGDQHDRMPAGAQIFEDAQ